MANQIASVTNAPVSPEDDVRHRTRMYILTMLIRTLCFGAVIFIDHWSRWIFAVGAVLLPYTAVVLANARRTPALAPASYVPSQELDR